MQVWVDGPNRLPTQVSAAVRDRVREMDLIALRNEKLGLGKELLLDPPAVIRMHAIHAPLLVIVGDEDNPTIIAGSEELSVGVAGARLVVMHNTAHVPNMERPDEFNQIVLEFLDRL